MKFSNALFDSVTEEKMWTITTEHHYMHEALFTNPPTPCPSKKILWNVDFQKGVMKAITVKKHSSD